MPIEMKQEHKPGLIARPIHSCKDEPKVVGVFVDPQPINFFLIKV
ncbi:Uncharacterised protein [Yersinia frederiksenii]|nr:Uncharacterised protein [Yersinia frederiksenii]CNJ00528.1 Uncharacterised protein [Yersinia frederiksenii]